MSVSAGTRKYLLNYAEPESGCNTPPRQYRYALTVPVFDEEPGFVHGLQAALRHVAPSLCILVVNHSEDSDNAAGLRTQELARNFIDMCKRTSTPNIYWADRGGYGDFLVVDRATAHPLPRGQGVGLARKIGCDLTLAWHARGCVESPWLFTTDADVRLPVDYFTRSESESASVALTYPFWHRCEPASLAGRALTLYEISLRYYVLGLRWAGSPYDFQTVGSTMAIRADAYAAVRGVPKRAAGEDFYLLNKLSKLGQVTTPGGNPIEIAGRDSQRTPFGTGAAMKRIAEELHAGRDFMVYAPTCFALLREWLDVMASFAENPDSDPLSALSRPELVRALQGMRVEDALAQARDQAKTSQVRAKRLSDWFDGFRTLKLIHALRDDGHPNRPWREAMEAAPFAPEVAGEGQMRRALADRELSGARRTGFWQLR